jgi:predicted AAA+ superfamily ATPase
MFAKTIENRIKVKLNSEKAIIVVGTQQVCKTTLLKLKEKIFQSSPQSIH